ncbi:hypothetical protein ACFYS8_06625 [Kitasatospora sp. NPDC004615]|uniref:hypothetical protein n=1 Tax=Kitasatospora sp. NPDC004615 TaxID=3364017 RepID=UPI0036B5AB2E
MPRPAAAERHLWTEEQAARFLRFTHLVGPLYADPAEPVIGTGKRKGEALALRRDDIAQCRGHHRRSPSTCRHDKGSAQVRKHLHPPLSAK